MMNDRATSRTTLTRVTTALADFLASTAGERLRSASTWSTRPRIANWIPHPAPAEPIAPPRDVVVERGQVWWADLGEPRGSGSGFQRPVLVVQSDAFNRSRTHTVMAVVLTNVRLVSAAGNVLVPAKAAGLPRDSVANVAQLRGQLLKDLENGLRLVLTYVVPTQLITLPLSWVATEPHDEQVLA